MHEKCKLQLCAVRARNKLLLTKKKKQKKGALRSMHGYCLLRD